MILDSSFLAGKIVMFDVEGVPHECDTLEGFMGKKIKVPSLKTASKTTGKWIAKHVMIRNPTAANYICSECGHENRATHFCPNCGANMEAGK